MVSFYVLALERASFDARSPVVSFLQEQLPLGDTVGVAEVRRDRQFLWRARDGEQLEAGLVREAVGLALVHVLCGPDEVFPRVHAAARAGHDVIEAACVRGQQHAGELAAVAIALADVLRADQRWTRIQTEPGGGFYPCLSVSIRG